MDEYGSLLGAVARRKEERLLAEARQREAEAEYLSRVAADYEAGRLSFPDLCRAYLSFRDVIGVGHSKRWDEVVPVTGQTIRSRLQNARRHHPKFQASTGRTFWSGSWPRNLETDTAPSAGQNVVYVLFDAEVAPCYIGSTANLIERLYKHVGDRKKFASWVAYPCTSREDAYAREEELLAQHRPYLNRRSTNGRGTPKESVTWDLPESHESPAVSRG